MMLLNSGLLSQITKNESLQTKCGRENHLSWASLANPSHIKTV